MSSGAAFDGDATPYAADLDIIAFCRTRGLPVRTHPFFRDMDKRWPAVLCELKDATVLGQYFIPICEGQLLADCLCYDGARARRKLSLRDDTGPRRVIRTEQAFLLGGDRTWGHFIVFNVMRTIHLQLFDHLRDVPVVTNAGLQPSLREILSIFGCPSGRLIELEENDALACEKLYVPTIAGGSTMDGKELFIPDKLSRLYRAMILEAHGGPHTTTPTEAVYLLRRNTKTKLIVNDANVTAFFAKRGYLVVDPAQMSLAEQVDLAQRAKYMVSAMGSQVHIMDFSRPGTKLLEFISEEHLYQRSFGPGPKRFAALGLDNVHMICDADADNNLTINLDQLSTVLVELGYPV